MDNSIHEMCNACSPMMRGMRRTQIDLETLPGRLRALMLVGGFRTQGAFVAKLGWRMSRLSNYLKDRPITRDAFQDLRRLFPGLAWEWIDEGDWDHLSVGLSRRIRDSVDTFNAGMGANADA